jgi:hypothetical protein
MSDHRTEPVLMGTEAERDRLIHRSLEAGRERLREHKAALIARHGCDDVRAFFLFAEIMRTAKLGSWLMLELYLLPYDDWNTVYLPTSMAMAGALGLPLHPQRDLHEFDEPIMKCVTTIQQQLAQAENALIAEKDNDLIPESIVAYRRVAREGIIKYAQKWRPIMIEHIAGLQRRTPDAAQ